MHVLPDHTCNLTNLRVHIMTDGESFTPVEALYELHFQVNTPFEQSPSSISNNIKDHRPAVTQDI